MNIESANLSSLLPTSVTVESMPPLVDGSVIPEGFSSALLAQLELLNTMKTENLSPIQVPDSVALQGLNDSQGVVGLPVDNTVDAQDFAALLGKDLPLSYKTKDDADHEAALVAVTDALKYIAMGSGVGEKAVEIGRNMNDVIATAVPVEQGMKDVAAMTVPVGQNMLDVAAMVVPVEQNIQEAVVAAAVPAEQDAADTAVDVEADQSMKDTATDAPVQMNLEPGSDKSDEKQSETRVASVEDSHGTEGVLAGIVLSVVMPAGQGKTTNNLTATDVIKDDGLLSFIRPSAGNDKPSQSVRVPNEQLESEAVVRQPVQDKQSFNLKYVENAGQTEKTGLIDKQALNLDRENAQPRIGTDITPFNRPSVDNKADVPAMTKPLSHPEWNKDMGERIVWMSSRAIPAAEIRLNPQHLGPISVRVDVTDDKATVVFTAQHAVVRETLEASIPKLREMMSSQQLNLVEVNVSQGPASDQGRSQSQNFAQTADGRGQSAAADVAVNGIDDIEQEIESGRAVVSKGLLSIYA